MVIFHSYVKLPEGTPKKVKLLGYFYWLTSQGQEKKHGPSVQFAHWLQPVRATDPSIQLCGGSTGPRDWYLLGDWIYGRSITSGSPCSNAEHHRMAIFH